MIISIPLHVSGIWIPHIEEDPLLTGSTGAGLNLELKCIAISNPGDCRITLMNNEEFREDSLSLCSEFNTNVYTKVRCPFRLGAGFAVSSALVIAHSISSSLLSGAGWLRGLQKAHLIEVTRGRGLGDVIAQYVGGFEIRARPGAPGVGIAYRVIHRESPALIVADLGSIEYTGHMVSRIPREHYERGLRMLREVMEKEDLQTFFEKARQFTSSIFDYDALKVLDSMKGVIGYYRKKSALVIWAEREYTREVLHELSKKGFNAYITSISREGVSVEDPR